jgi:hypothetical protein
MAWQSFRDVSAYGDETNGASTSIAFRAFWAVVLDKTYGGPTERSDTIQKWKNEVIAELLQQREPITRVQRINAMLYRGRHYLNQDRDVPFLRGKKYDKNFAKIVLNFLGQATDQHVADMSGFEPNLVVRPHNEEEGDRSGARTAKQCIDHYFRIWKLKTAFQRFHRRKKIMGETFKFVLWDDSLGDYHPKYKELRRIKLESGQDPDQSFPLLNPETGEPILGEDGEQLFISPAIRVGDISLEDEYSERVLYPCPESYQWEDVPWIIRLRWLDIDEVKARWPKSADDIKVDGMYRNYMGPNSKALHQKVCVRFMYHKPTRFLPSGYYCASTESSFLEAEGRSVANHDELPVIRGTDIDVEYEITGMSFYQNLASLQAAINNSTSMILQNQSLFAYPKYVSPRGAKVKYVELNDDRGVYEYSGPQGPELIAANSTPADTWRWSDYMRSSFQTLSQIFQTSEGRAPDGVTANVALRMLDEQERKFHKPAIDKHGENVELLGKLILSTLGTYRLPDDGALIQIIGKNNERALRYFDVTDLGKPYTVELTKSSGLPENPAAKTQTVLDLADRFEGMWSHDEVLEYLDIARPEKLVESATIARQAAESEMEDLISGSPNVPPPSLYHDILPRYRVYEKAVQSRSFDEADPLIKQRVTNHIIAAEYLIAQKMTKNPTFIELVMQQHPNFPMFFPLKPTMNQPFQLAQPPAPTPAMDSMSLGGVPPEEAAESPSLMESKEAPPDIVPQQGQPPEQSVAPQPGALP